MQFVTMHEPTRASGWGTALGAGSDIVRNLMNVYTNYNAQKKAEEQQAFENAEKIKEHKLRQELYDRQKAQEELQNAMTARTLALQEADYVRPGDRPTVEGAPQAVQIRDLNGLIQSGEAKPEAPALAGLQLGAARSTQMTQPEAAPVENMAIPAVQDSTGRVLAQATQRPVRYQSDVNAQAEAVRRQNELAAGNLIEVTPEMDTAIRAMAEKHPGLKLFVGQKYIRKDVIDDAVKAAGGGGGKPPDTKRLVVGGVEHEMGWNPETGKYDIDYGRTYHAAGEGGGGKTQLTPGQAWEAERNIMNNYNKMTADARKAQMYGSGIESAFKAVQEAIKKGERVNANTQAIVTLFNKITDPASVVRESEYARSTGDQALWDQLVGKIQAWRQGGPGLTEASLKDLKDAAAGMLQRFRENSMNNAALVEKQAAHLAEIQLGHKPNQAEVDEYISRILTPADFNAYQESKRGTTSSGGTKDRLGILSTTPVGGAGLVKPPKR